MRVDDWQGRTSAWRVAVVTETWPPEVNGVATTLSRLVQGLVERGHTVQLIRPRQPGLPQDPTAAQASGLQEHLGPGWALPRYPGLRMGAPRGRYLRQLWSRERPDVVHIATEGPLGWSARRTAMGLGLPVTSDFRTNFHAYASHYGLAWAARPVLALLRYFHNHTHATMVPTEAMRSELRAQGFERLHVVGRGVDTALFHPKRRSQALRRQWGVTEDDLVLACVGRLAAEKNLGVVLQAFEAVRQQHPRARLLLVGDGPLREELRTACPQAIVAGQRRGVDLAAHYASADLFVFASLTETFGNVTTEALASGLPLLAFNHAAAGQLVQSGHNGVLAEAGDEAAFVREALALANDGLLRQRLAVAARETACRSSWALVVSHFEAVVEVAMATRMESIRDGFAELDEAAAFTDTVGHVASAHGPR